MSLTSQPRDVARNMFRPENRNAAIDENALAGDKAGFVAAEKVDEIRAVFGPSHALQWHEALVESPQRRLVAIKRLVFRFDEAQRHHRIGTNALRPQCRRVMANELVEAGFGDMIAGGLRAADEGRVNRAYNRNSAISLGRETRTQGLDQEPRRRHADLQLTRPRIGR